MLDEIQIEARRYHSHVSAIHDFKAIASLKNRFSEKDLIEYKFFQMISLDYVNN